MHTPVDMHCSSFERPEHLENSNIKLQNCMMSVHKISIFCPIKFRINESKYIIIVYYIHSGPACRVWSRQVRKRQSSCGTDKQKDKSKLQYNMHYLYCRDFLEKLLEVFHMIKMHNLLFSTGPQRFISGYSRTCRKNHFSV